jgi:multiple sugar transport system permease protein
MPTARRNKVQDEALLNLQRTCWYIVLVILTFICLFSFYILIINATRSNADIQKGFSLLPGASFFVNLKNVLDNENLPVLRGILNSFFIAACVAVLSTYFSTLTAYGIHAYRFRHRNAAYVLILAIMMVPTQVSALGFIKLMSGFGLMDTYVPLILPTVAAPIVFFFMKQYMESALPVELVEAARIDGSSEFGTFNRIVIPIMKPAIAVQIIFTFVNSWNNYFLPALIIDSTNKKTLPVLIAQLRSADYLKFDLGQVYVLIAIAIVPVMILYLILSKFIVRGVAIGSVKG